MTARMTARFPINAKMQQGTLTADRTTSFMKEAVLLLGICNHSGKPQIVPCVLFSFAVITTTKWRIGGIFLWLVISVYFFSKRHSLN